MKQVRGYTPNSDSNFTIPTFKFSVFFLALLQELAKFVDNILSNDPSRVSSTEPYLWMWEIFAEPGSPQDEKLCEDFWESVVKSANDMIKKNIRQTENTSLVSSAYSYLRANFGTAVRDAYTNLKKAFRISSDKDFNLLLICDEARTLCEISAIDGKTIPAELDFDPDMKTESSTETEYFPFSNFRAFRRGLSYLKLAKSPSDAPASISLRKDKAPSRKRQVIAGQSSKRTFKAQIPRIF